jgi:hypothetical protein
MTARTETMAAVFSPLVQGAGPFPSNSSSRKPGSNALRNTAYRFIADENEEGIDGRREYIVVARSKVDRGKRKALVDIDGEGPYPVGSYRNEQDEDVDMNTLDPALHTMQHRDKRQKTCSATKPLIGDFNPAQGSGTRTDAVNVSQGGAEIGSGSKNSTAA